MREHLYKSMRGEPRETVEAKLRAWATENAIERALLEQAIAKEPQEFSAEQNLDRLVERHGGRVGAPKLKEINEYFRKYRDQFEFPDRVHVAHILKVVKDPAGEAAAMAGAVAIAEELSRGVSFEEILARPVEDGGFAGDMGLVPAGQLPAEFDNVVFALAPGEVSAVFRTSHGFHIAKVYEHQKARKATFEEARPTIERKLKAQKHQRALDRVVDYFRARSVIER